MNALFSEVGDEVVVRYAGRTFLGTVIYALDRLGHVQVATAAATVASRDWRSLLFNAETLRGIAAPAELIIPQDDEEWWQLRREMEMPTDLGLFQQDNHPFEFTTEPTEYEPTPP